MLKQNVHDTKAPVEVLAIPSGFGNSRLFPFQQELCPDKYEWLKQQQQQEGTRHARGKRGRKRKKHHKNPAIDQYRFHREELVRILAEPADDLNRREVHVRKLLHKFHDDPRLVSSHGPAASPEAHDLSLAERTRSKNNHHRTATEKEWISLDRILNPTVSHMQMDRACLRGVQLDTFPLQVLVLLLPCYNVPRYNCMWALRRQFRFRHSLLCIVSCPQYIGRTHGPLKNDTAPNKGKSQTSRVSSLY